MIRWSTAVEQSASKTLLFKKAFKLPSRNTSLKEQEYNRSLLSSVLVRSKHKRSNDNMSKKSKDKEILQFAIEKVQNCT